MAALLIRRRRPLAEPAGHAATLDGTRGAGRIVAALAELGIELGTVRQVVVDADAAADDLDRIEANRQAAVVVLGSHLINRPEAPIRQALLGLARRHLADGGELLIEHHPVDWAETASEVRATPGGAPGMVEVRRDPPFVSAISVYDAGGRVESQPFRARVLSEDELDAELASAGLKVVRRVGPTWIEAVVGARRTP